MILITAGQALAIILFLLSKIIRIPDLASKMSDLVFFFCVFMSVSNHFCMDISLSFIRSVRRH